MLACSIFLGGINMSKVVDITDKLDFEENPKIKIKDAELEADASAENMLKVLGLVSDNPTAEDVIKMCEIIFTKESHKKLMNMKLSFKDFQTVVMTTISVIMGDEEEESGE